jgi:hypothetical protein
MCFGVWAFKIRSKSSVFCVRFKIKGEVGCWLSRFFCVRDYSVNPFYSVAIAKEIKRLQRKARPSWSRQKKIV